MPTKHETHLLKDTHKTLKHSKTERSSTCQFLIQPCNLRPFLQELYESPEVLEIQISALPGVRLKEPPHQVFPREVQIQSPTHLLYFLECKFVVTLLVCTTPVPTFPDALPCLDMSKPTHELLTYGIQLAHRTVPQVKDIRRGCYDM